MFEKLVVSSRGRRKHRSLKFFLATSAIYLFSLSCALALSVVLSTPEIADLSEYQASNLIVPVARLGQPEQQRPASGQPQSAPRPDYRNPVSLDEYLSDRSDAPASRVRLDAPPVAGPITGNVGSGDGSLFAGGIPGLPGAGSYGDPNGEAGLPPKPEPPAPAQKPQMEPEKKIVRVPSVVLQGKAIERPAPAYPPLARTANVEGPVAVEIVIAPNGRVESARVMSGHPLLASAALEAARRWRFEPTLLNNSPVRVIGTITFVFKLRE